MSHLSFSWKRRRDLAAVSFIYPPISSLQNSLLGGEQGGGRSRACWQRSGPLPETRKPDILFTLGKTQMFWSQSARRCMRTLSPRLHVRLPRRACAAPAWNRRLVNISEGGKWSQVNWDFLKGHVWWFCHQKAAGGHRIPHIDLRLSISYDWRTKTQRWVRGRIPAVEHTAEEEAPLMAWSPAPRAPWVYVKCLGKSQTSRLTYKVNNVFSPQEFSVAAVI